MKLIKSTLLLLSFIAVGCVISNAQNNDPVEIANDANDEKADADIVDEDVANFLVKSADARMMDSMEGKLATKKSTRADLRKYGSWMVKDQSILLSEIKKLAAKRKITLPTGISDNKEDGREDLAGKTGKDFDEKFIKMMIKDHERDVKLFKKAVDCDNKEISAFAKKYLPVIQSHLDKINTIKDKME